MTDAPRPMRALTANTLLGRLLLACLLVSTVATLAYLLMVFVALKGDATPPGALFSGVAVGAMGFATLAALALALRPCFGRLVSACTSAEPPGRSGSIFSLLSGATASSCPSSSALPHRSRSTSTCSRS